MNDTDTGHILLDDPRAYLFFSTTVSLTTSYAEGRSPNVMANEWVMNVCWQPLRIMAVVHHENLTSELISASKEFGINICSVDQAHLAHYAGNVSGHTADKFAHELFQEQTYKAMHIKAPMIKGCVLNAECVLEEIVELGDYTGFIGRALTTYVNQKLRPLLYTRGKYFFLGNQIPKAIAVDLT